MIAAPIYAPKVLARMTPKRFNRPCAATKAAIGTTASAGNGIGVLLIAINRMIPQ